MLSIWTISGVVALYLLLLFGIAFWADRRKSQHQQHPYIYSLALGVHCTSWAFFGTTTQAAQYGWAFVPTYVGMICVFLFAFGLLQKIASYCQTHQISSLADFVGSRYQNHLGIGALVTLICFVGVVPYIALQLDAITLSLSLISDDKTQATSSVGLYVAALMALFAILFGTRTLSLTEKHPGLMATIAFESLLKLIGICIVGIYVCFWLFSGPLDLVAQAVEVDTARNIIYADSALWVYVCHILLGVCAAFCLPRQFHISFVENNGERELQTARWLFPLYLVLMSVFVLPIALAGSVLLDTTQFTTDSYTLAIPITQGNSAISIIAFVGGISAATSMVIVATLALGIMISNNLVTPLWLRFTLSTKPNQPMPTTQILTIRRITVLVVLTVAYGYHIRISQSAPLVQSGTIAMALLAQLVPAILVSFFWQRSNALAAWLGILTGSAFWFSLLLWPSITASYYFGAAPTDADLGTGFVISLAANLAVHGLISLFSASSNDTKQVADDKQPSMAINITDMLTLLERIIPQHQYADLLAQIGANTPTAIASRPLLARCERLLAAQVGVAGAKILLSTIATKDNASMHDLVELAEQASQTLQFNHEVLQSSVQHIQQGISVLDRNLAMLAWNERYLELFDYPTGFIKVGMSIETILRMNAERGLFGDVTDIDAEISKRIGFMRNGSDYKYVRKQNDRKTIEINGSPLPNGGYVTTYSDISDYIHIQEELTRAKLDLESRVIKRTEQLELARIAADQANQSKTKFLAAAGHDLMQPFNAAILYASMLSQRTVHDGYDVTIKQISDGIQQSLNSAETLLSTLLDMTKLESGVLDVNVSEFELGGLLSSLITEFSVIASQQGVTLTYVPTQVYIRSDKKLLRRVLQNLLSNAIRYKSNGAYPRVLIGVRRRSASNIDISILDNGVGIESTQQQIIFDEFHQINPDQNTQGLGLGLTIVERMTKLLHHPITLNSKYGQGTCFAIGVPRVLIGSNKVETTIQIVNPNDVKSENFLLNKTILVIENDPQIQQAVSSVLESWGATVKIADSISSILINCTIAPDLMLVDYHLNAGENGIDAVASANAVWNKKVPGILVTANRADSIRDDATNAGLDFLPKPVKLAALKRSIRKTLL